MTETSREIRILQLSDLLFCPEPSKDILHHLKNAIPSAALQQRFDYLVICGNITTKANEATIKRAAIAIANFAKEVLPQESPESIAQRLMIVPGATDCDSSGTFIDFENFQRQLAKNLHFNQANVEPLATSHIMFRHLKDLTLIGTCCFEGVRDPSRTLLPFLEATHGLAKKAHGIPPFTLKTPTIFVSSDSFQAKWLFAKPRSKRIAEKVLRQIEDLEHLLSKTINITLHLFGSGHVRWQPPQPFGPDYPAVGTGPRIPRQPWPINFNIISITTADTLDADDPTVTHGFEIRSYHLPIAGAGLQKSPEGNASDNKKIFIPRKVKFNSESSEIKIFEPLINDIVQETLKPDVRGLIAYNPDHHGIKPFSDMLVRARYLREGEVLVLGWPEFPIEERPEGMLSSTTDISQNLEAFRNWVTRHVQHILGQIPQNVHRLTNRLLIVIDDRKITGQSRGLELGITNPSIIKVVFSRIPETSGPVGKLKTNLKIATLYLVEAVDAPPRDLPNKSTILSFGYRSTRFEPLSQLYSTNVPIKSKHMAALTGQHIGLCFTIQDQATKSFRDHAGNTVIDSSFENHLLQEALSEISHDNYWKVFVERLDQLAPRVLRIKFSTIAYEELSKIALLSGEDPTGEKFLDNLSHRKVYFEIDNLAMQLDRRAKVSKNRLATDHLAANTGANLTRLDADTTQGDSAPCDREIFKRILQKYFAHLERLGIVESEKQKESHRYRLVAVLPYLVTRKTGSLFKTVYLAYPREEIEFVREIYGQIRAANHWVFLDKEDLKVGVEWKEQLREAFFRADRVLIFLTNAWKVERFFATEVEWAKERTQIMLNEEAQPESIVGMIRIDGCDLPPCLKDLHAVGANDANCQSQILRWLDSEGTY